MTPCDAAQRMFLIDFEYVQACNLHCRPETLAKGILSFPGDTDVTGDARIRQQVVKRQTILNPPEESMKTLLVVPLVGLAICFALPTFAQQTYIN